MSSDIHVKGLAQLQAYLSALPVKLEKNCMRGALRSGANVIAAQAKINAPKGPPNKENVRLYGGYEGALRDSIRVTTNVKGGTVYAHVKVGGKNKKTGADVFYAHFIEGFWRHHTTSPYKMGGWLVSGGIVHKPTLHPPLVAHPFLRPAMDTQAQKAVIAAGEYLKQRLATKEGIDTADILVEGDL